MRAAFRIRIRIVLAALLVVALLILARLYFVQVVHGSLYADKADRQYAAGGGSLFDRGSIYFTTKEGDNVSAATLSSGFLAAINPQTIRNPEAAYTAIRAYATTTLSRESFLSAAADKSRVYVEVAHQLPAVLGTALAAKKIPGVTLYRERWRAYPGSELAANAIGYVSYDGDALTGQAGLERQYNETLTRSGNSLYENFFAQLFSNVGNLIVRAEDAREGDVITTIEPEVEARLVADLEAVQAKYSSRETGGIIMDPATGAILAMATTPSFDPNDIGSADQALAGNPLVGHVYEFGSIMKPLTMATGLDSGAITATTTYNDTGCIHVNAATICNFDLKARGVVPMQQILSQSLNVGASWIATQMGSETFRTYFSHLFGAKTGIDLPGEGAALLSNLESPRQVEFDNMSFGQGIAVTPVQMIRALGALANHGTMVRPHVAAAVRLDSGVTRTIDWSVSAHDQVFRADTAREVSTMLSVVADKSLANGADRMPNMSFAAKTGTAELTTPQGGYYKDRYFHSFIGYFPAYTPRFIILLYTNDPQGVKYASETLTSTYVDLMHFLINYYTVAPDRGLPASTGQADSSHATQQ